MKNSFNQKCFWIKFFLDQQFILAKNLLALFLGAKSFRINEVTNFLYQIMTQKPKCTWEWSLTLAWAQLVSVFYFGAFLVSKGGWKQNVLGYSGKIWSQCTYYKREMTSFFLFQGLHTGFLTSEKLFRQLVISASLSFQCDLFIYFEVQVNHSATLHNVRNCPQRR